MNKIEAKISNLNFTYKMLDVTQLKFNLLLTIFTDNVAEIASEINNFF